MEPNKIALVVVALLLAGTPCCAQQQQTVVNPQKEALLGTLKRLSDDASDRTGAIKAEAGTATGVVQSSAKATAQAILAEGDRVAREMRTTYISDGKNKTRVYSDSEINAEKEKYAARADAALHAGDLKQRQISDAYTRRQKALQESATNLQEQLLQKPAGADSVILQAVGTNLYVRNYQSVGELYEKGPAVRPLKAVPQLGGYPTRGANSVLTGTLLTPLKK